MTEERFDQPDSQLDAELRPGALSHRIGEVYRAPGLSPARRAAYDARLAERLDASSGWLPVGMARPLLIAAIAAVLIAVIQGLGPTSSRDPLAPDLSGGSEVVVLLPAFAPADTDLDASIAARGVLKFDDALLTLTSEAIVDDDESLPADYAAIDSLFFGGM